ncbi:MAG: 4a-hydroxytetrahydrobiopterin dehydratase [Acidobacteriaceae bacterium]
MPLRMPQILSDTQIQSALACLPAWKVEHGELTRTAVFADFLQAMAFVNRVAGLAESAGHHPDMDIRYNKVRLGLCTHDAGGITQKDMNLAQEIDKNL